MFNDNPIALLLTCLFFSSFTAKANMTQADAAYDAQNYTAAIKEYTQSATVGVPRAMHTLGFIYYQGQGVAVDKAESEIWFLLAAQYKYENSKSIARSILAWLIMPILVSLRSDLSSMD